MKNHVIYASLLVSLLFAGCNQHGVESVSADQDGTQKSDKSRCTSWDGDVCKPLMFGLLANPDEYHEIDIELAGFGSWGERSLIIYPTVDMACSQTVTGGVELDHSVEVSDGAVTAIANNGVVPMTVRGNFKADLNGLAGRYVGHLDHAQVLHFNLSRSSLRVDPRKLNEHVKESGQEVAIDLPEPKCN